MEIYHYSKNEIVFILHHLNERKIKDYLSIGRNKFRDNFVLQCFDVARAYQFLSNLEQQVVAHLYFYKDSINYISRYLRLEKERIFYLKRQSIKKIVQILNGSDSN